MAPNSVHQQLCLGLILQAPPNPQSACSDRDFGTLQQSGLARCHTSYELLWKKKQFVIHHVLIWILILLQPNGSAHIHMYSHMYMHSYIYRYWFPPLRKLRNCRGGYNSTGFTLQMGKVSTHGSSFLYSWCQGNTSEFLYTVYIYIYIYLIFSRWMSAEEVSWSCN